MTEDILLTKEGYEKIEKEHDELVTIKRPEIAERIKEAISYGDISENAEYDSAKNEQAELEEKIQRLENMMRMAKIIDDKHVSDDVVNVGLIVEIKEKNKKSQEYSIVGSAEADPFKGKISNESPLGQALLGKKKGDSVDVALPGGTNIVVKVIDIKKMDEVKGAKADKSPKKEKVDKPVKKAEKPNEAKEAKKAAPKKAETVKKDKK